MRNKTVILTVGLPRAGKTSWANMQRFAVISVEAAKIVVAGPGRLSAEAANRVHFFMMKMLRVLLLAQDTVVVDWTFHTAESRARWRSKHWQTYYKVFEASLEQCLERSVVAEGLDIAEVIRDFHDEFEPLSKAEKACEWVDD